MLTHNYCIRWQVPSGPAADQAMAALQAEVRCIKHAGNSSNSAITTAAAASGTSATPSGASPYPRHPSAQLEATLQSLLGQLSKLESEMAAAELLFGPMGAGAAAPQSSSPAPSARPTGEGAARKQAGGGGSSSGGGGGGDDVMAAEQRGELVAALQAEIRRLQAAQTASNKAASALRSLQKKVSGIERNDGRSCCIKCIFSGGLALLWLNV